MTFWCDCFKATRARRQPFWPSTSIPESAHGSLSYVRSAGTWRSEGAPHADRAIRRDAERSSEAMGTASQERIDLLCKGVEDVGDDVQLERRGRPATVDMPVGVVDGVDEHLDGWWQRTGHGGDGVSDGWNGRSPERRLKPRHAAGKWKLSQRRTLKCGKSRETRRQVTHPLVVDWMPRAGQAPQVNIGHLYRYRKETQSGGGM